MLLSHFSTPIVRLTHYSTHIRRTELFVCESFYLIYSPILCHAHYQLLLICRTPAHCQEYIKRGQYGPPFLAGFLWHPSFPPRIPNDSLSSFSSYQAVCLPTRVNNMLQYSDAEPITNDSHLAAGPFEIILQLLYLNSSLSKQHLTSLWIHCPNSWNSLEHFMHALAHFFLENFCSLHLNCLGTPTGLH